MTRLVVVPDSLRNDINDKLESAYQDCPDARADHEALYADMLAYFDEHGGIPDITLKRRDTL